MLTNSVHVASVVAVDLYGKSTYETPRKLQARVQGQRRMVRSQSGDEVVSSHVIYTLAEVKPTDRIWLPGASTASIEASNIPLTITNSPDRTSFRTLWKVEL